MIWFNFLRLSKINVSICALVVSSTIPWFLIEGILSENGVTESDVDLLVALPKVVGLCYPYPPEES